MLAWVRISHFLKLMAQKLNSTNMRLKKRSNWKTIFSIQNFKNYNVINYQQIKLLELTIKILKNFGIILNSFMITKDLKNYQLSSELIDDVKILKEMIVTNKKNGGLTKDDFEQKLRNTLLKSKSRMIQQLNTKLFNNFLIFSGLYNLKKKATKNSNIFLKIWPELIISYTKNQMSQSNKIKNQMFNRSFQLGLLKLINALITTESRMWCDIKQRFITDRLVIKNIAGLKLEFCGRWRKTKAGRTQKLKINIGQTQKNSLKTLVLYNFSTEKTKYAACGIKVWIAYKNINQTFLA